MQAFRLIVVVVLGLAIAVQTTAEEKDAKKSSVKEKLLGRWKTDGNAIVEFAKDGKYTVVITAAQGKGITLEGTWKLLNDKQFQATLKNPKRKDKKTHAVEILKLTDTELVTKEGDLKITL